MAPRAWAQDSKDLQAELYMVRVLSETLESRERRSRARSAAVRPSAGARAFWSFSGAGMSGFCRAISGHLNSSYNVNYRKRCPSPGKGQLSVCILDVRVALAATCC